MSDLAPAVLLLVFLLIAVRRLGPFRFEIWQVMLLGASAVLLSGSISAEDAMNAVNLDVIVFLFGMFVIGQGIEMSGYLSHLSYKAFKRAGSVDLLVLYILFGIGLSSAVLMNDTCAIIGTPVVLLLARKHGISPKLLLLALAFAITLGSVPSPIGNPQNLLIALDGGLKTPFIDFGYFLLLPTVINLFFAYILLRLLYKKEFHKMPLDHSEEPIKDKRLAHLSRLSLFLVGFLVVLRIASTYFFPGTDFRLTYIAVAGALPIALFSGKRIQVIKRIDWSTLVFFASMFVLMESVWDSGFFQGYIYASGADMLSIPSILSVSVIISQLISNVPLVALYMPLLVSAGAGTKELMALAAGSTIAGNLFILGAASNVIIIQNAEKKAHETLSFMEFARIGIPLTFINALVYWVFLSLA